MNSIDIAGKNSPLNPYSPPRSEVASPERTELPWHAKTLVAILFVWGCSSSINAVLNLASASVEDRTLVRAYAGSIVPGLLFTSAYLLWKRTHWVLVTLALLSALPITSSLVMRPESIVKGRSIALGLASAMSPELLGVTVFYVFCFVYAGFLKKWGHVR